MFCTYYILYVESMKKETKKIPNYRKTVKNAPTV